MENLKLIPLDLSTLSKEIIEVLLLDSNVEPSLFKEIAQKNVHRPEILYHLLNHPNTPGTTRQFIAQILQMPVPEVAASEAIREHRTQNLFQRIQKLRVGEKIQLALRGSRDIRSILIRDTNKEVILTVLENPKITESEIEIIAKQKTSPEEIIRAIAEKKDWLKNYSIVHALVTNPKTPTTIAMKFIKNLRLKDLLMIEKDKNIPGVIRETAKKLVATKRLS
jgi:hypothetical protein